MRKKYNVKTEKNTFVTEHHNYNNNKNTWNQPISLFTFQNLSQLSMMEPQCLYCDLYNAVCMLRMSTHIMLRVNALLIDKFIEVYFAW